MVLAVKVPHECTFLGQVLLPRIRWKMENDNAARGYEINLSTINLNRDAKPSGSSGLHPQMGAITPQGKAKIRGGHPHKMKAKYLKHLHDINVSGLVCQE